jgi:signal transduction histidine kinase
MDFHMKCADNTWRWIHSAGRPVEYDEDGKVVRVTGIFMDITDLRNSCDSLERTNRKLSLLSSVTRHDVLNQIMGILLLKDYILGRCAAGDTDVKEDLNLIFTAVETIQHQMEFAGDYQDLGMKEPEWQNVRDLIRSILITRNLDALNLDADIGDLEIYADHLFEKVLYNLIDNSLRHGKTVTEIRLSFEEHENCGKLIYIDDGVGVPDDLKESIFERGFGSNTGLGLFLIREILEVTGFTIVECGMEGEGARF